MSRTNVVDRIHPPCPRSIHSPESGETRQDDYDIWLGTDVLDTWIAWDRHGANNCLFLDGHARPLNKTEGYFGMYPGGQVYRDQRFYDK